VDDHQTTTITTMVVGTENLIIPHIPIPETIIGMGAQLLMRRPPMLNPRLQKLRIQKYRKWRRRHQRQMHSSNNEEECRIDIAYRVVQHYFLVRVDSIENFV
jgi:hypothetical protein